MKIQKVEEVDTKELWDNLLIEIQNELDFKIKLIEPEVCKDKNGEYIKIAVLDECYSITDPRSKVNTHPELKCLPEGYKVFVHANETISLRIFR